MAAMPKEQKLKRDERPYSEADVRECLNKMLDQYEVGVDVESAYVIASGANWPQMRDVVRVLGALCPCTRPPSRQHPLDFACVVVRAGLGELTHARSCVRPSQLNTARTRMLSANFATLSAKRAFANSWTYPKRGGTQHSIKIFSDDEEEILVSFCNIALEGSFGVSKEFVHELMCELLRTPDRKASSSTSVSMSMVKTWMRVHNLKRLKSNSIDPARVAKATERVRDAWFARVDRCAALATPASVHPCSHPIRAAAASVQPPRPCSRRVRPCSRRVHAAAASVRAAAAPCRIDGACACACLGTSGSCTVRPRSQRRGRAGTTCRRAPSSMCASRLERRRLDDR